MAEVRASCQFCGLDMDTGSNHEIECPLNPSNQHKWTTDWEPDDSITTYPASGYMQVLYPIPTGWLCPRCNKVWGPSVRECDCKPPIGPQCIRCGFRRTHGTVRLIYPSTHDGEWICMECIDGLLAEGKG